MMSTNSTHYTASRRRLLISTYQELDVYVEDFIEGTIGLMIIVGRGGIGKTERIRPYIEQDKARLIRGTNLTAFDLHRQAWEYRDQPIIIDDVDRLLRSPDTVNSLKNLCDRSPKMMTWNSSRLKGRAVAAAAPPPNPSAEGVEPQPQAVEDPDYLDDSVPKTFSTTSRVLIIMNELTVKDTNVEALLTRGDEIHFDPSGDEVHREAAKWSTDDEVYEFIGQWASMVKLNFRDYDNAAHYNVRKRVPWKDNLLKLWGVTPPMVLVYKLNNDTRYTTDKQRVDAFKAANLPDGNSPSYYYKLKASLKSGPNPRSYKAVEPVESPQNVTISPVESAPPTEPGPVTESTSVQPDGRQSEPTPTDEPAETHDQASTVGNPELMAGA